jgi:hypothetical protein
VPDGERLEPRVFTPNYWPHNKSLSLITGYVAPSFLSIVSGRCSSEENGGRPEGKVGEGEGEQESGIAALPFLSAEIPAERFSGRGTWASFA